MLVGPRNNCPHIFCEYYKTETAQLDKTDDPELEVIRRYIKRVMEKENSVKQDIKTPNFHY